MKFLADQQRDHVPGLDMTPLVDMVFLLIIFFLTTSSLVKMTSARVDLPLETGEDETRSRSPGLVVNIAADGALIVEGQSVTPAALLEMVRAEVRKAGGDGASVDLLVRADRAAPLEHLNGIATGLAQMGVRSWRLATEVPRRASAAAGGGA